MKMKNKEKALIYTLVTVITFIINPIAGVYVFFVFVLDMIFNFLKL